MDVVGQEFPSHIQNGDVLGHLPWQRQGSRCPKNRRHSKKGADAQGNKRLNGGRSQEVE